MRTRTTTRFRRALAIALAATTALLLTAVALPASAASPDHETLPVTLGSAGVLASTSNASRAPGWKLPSGGSQDGAVTADGALRLSNAGTVPGFSHLGYVTPALTTTAGEAGVGDVNTFDVGFTLDSATSAYQADLSVAVSLDDAARGWSRYGGIVWFMHLDGVLKIGSFGLDPMLNTGTRPVVSSSIVWTETVLGEFDPAVPHDIRLVGTYRPGPGNDTLDVYVDGSLAGSTRTFEGYAEVKNQAPAEVGSLSFFFGPNTTSKTGIPILDSTKKADAVAGAGFEFSNIVLRSYDVDLEVPTEAPPTLPPLTSTPDGSLTTPESTSTDVEVDVVGTGFEPFETVLLTLNSTPTFLGWVTADLHGSFRTSVKIPASVDPGTHTVQAVGQRSAWTVTSAILVTLPVTGSDIRLPLAGALIALGALAAGLALTLGVRRRTA